MEVLEFLDPGFFIARIHATSARIGPCRKRKAWQTPSGSEAVQGPAGPPESGEEEEEEEEEDRRKICLRERIPVVRF